MKRLDFLRILASIPFFGNIVTKGAPVADVETEPISEQAATCPEFAEKDSLLLYKDEEAIACTANADLLFIDGDFLINVSGRLFFDSSHSIEDLMEMYINEQILRFRLAKKDQKDSYFEGSVIISSISVSAPMAEEAIYDISFSGVGSLTLMDESYEEEV